MKPQEIVDEIAEWVSKIPKEPTPIDAYLVVAAWWILCEMARAWASEGGASNLRGTPS